MLKRGNYYWADSEDMHEGYDTISDRYHRLNLPEGNVHIWRVPIDELFCQINRLSETLSKDEIERADNFYFEKDKMRYIIRRWILRTITSFYIPVEAGRLQFCYGKHGKPDLHHSCNSEKLKFNLSHSGGFALYAFSCGSDVGIDIEQIREMPEMDQIVEYYFSDTEKIFFRSLPENMKKPVFFKIWTRKESLLKGIGDGLHQPLNQFAMLSETNKISENKEKTPRWHIEDLFPAAGYAAAYALKEISGQHWNNCPNTSQKTKVTIQNPKWLYNQIR